MSAVRVREDSKVPTPLSVAVALKDTKAQEMLLAAGSAEQNLIQNFQGRGIDDNR